MKSQAVSPVQFPDPNFGRPEPNSDELCAYIATQRLADKSEVRTFKNVVRGKGQCGGAGSRGQQQYVVNTDTTHAYRVTLRYFQTGGGQPAKDDEQVVPRVEAGGENYLGCSEVGDFYIRYEVVGEVVI